MSSVSLIFVLCLASLHASNARLLLSASNIDNQIGRNAYQEAAEKVEIMANELSDETSNPSIMKSANIGATSAAGNEITKSFSDIDQGQKGQTRSMLGSIPQYTEEAVDTKRGYTLDGVDNMDYSLPHMRPPIHNNKP